MSVIYGLLTLELDIIQIYHHIFGNWFYKYACYGSQELETLYMLATVVSQNFKLRNSLFDPWKSNVTRIVFSCTVFIYVMMVVLFLHRVLTVHGSDDSVVRVEEALGFAKVIVNHKQQATYHWRRRPQVLWAKRWFGFHCIVYHKRTS